MSVRAPNLTIYAYTVGLIITTRNFGQCVVNLYEVQKTQCVVIVGWSKILKIRVSYKLNTGFS